MKKTTKKLLHVVHYFALAIVLLGSYWLASLFGIVPWAFKQSIFVQTSVLTIYYGTVLWITDEIIHAWWKI